MSTRHRFVLTGGGTGGHVYPALAVARVLRDRGHQVLFIGTSQGIEARLVPEAGFAMQYIRSSGLNRVGVVQKLRSAVQLPVAVAVASRILGSFQTAAVFSMGGYVAGPVMIAALLRRIPLIIMEPNAIPGFASRKVGSRVYRALVSFEMTARWFPRNKTEITGLPVRSEFFTLQPKTTGPFTVLITGGSRGSRTLNRAARESWPLFQQNGSPVRLIHQTGPAEYDMFRRHFDESGINGELVPFLSDMPTAFSRADLVIGRAGAGGVSELAAAGKPSILVPFPYAADDHQKANAQQLVDAGAARLVLDADLSGQRLFEEVEQLRTNPEQLRSMREKAQQFARPGAAERAAAVLEEAAQRHSQDNAKS